MSNNCVACGMPMSTKEDHALSDTSKDYCKYCMTSDGAMQSYDEKLESFTKFIMKTQSLPQDEAQQTARQRMATLPAWKK